MTLQTLATDEPQAERIAPTAKVRAKVQRRPRGTRLDGRSREYALQQRTIADLTASVGGTPSPAQSLLIRQAGALVVRLWQADANVAPGQTMPETGTKHYVSLANALTRVLLRLDRDTPAKPKARPNVTMAEFLAASAKAASL